MKFTDAKNLLKRLEEKHDDFELWAVSVINKYKGLSGGNGIAAALIEAVIPDEELELFMYLGGAEFDYALAQNPHTPAWYLQHIVQDSYHRRDLDVFKESELLAGIIPLGLPIVLRLAAVAQNPNVPPETLEELAGHYMLQIAASAAKNPRTPQAYVDLTIQKLEIRAQKCQAEIDAKVSRRVYSCNNPRENQYRQVLDEILEARKT